MKSIPPLWTVRRFRSLLLIVGVIWIVTPLSYYSFRSYRLPTEQNHHFKIPAGSSLRKVAFALEEEGIITNPHLFMALVILRGGEDNLLAGTYDFHGETSLYKVADDIINGRIAKRRVTLPEGLNLDGIATRLHNIMGWEQEEVINLGTDPELLSYLGLGTNSLEGFLFPDTYQVPVDIAPRDLFKLMIQRYREVFNDTLREKAKELGVSEIEIVTLASIIEKETRLDSERKIISGVFHNRLRKGIPLEADPTVRYALGKYTGRILYKDLEVDSPYNTYRNRDLPPGPICNPGKASVLAALYPEDVNYLYFVAAGDGSHIFSQTLAQHNMAKKKVKNPDS